MRFCVTWRLLVTFLERHRMIIKLHIHRIIDYPTWSSFAPYRVNIRRLVRRSIFCSWLFSGNASRLVYTAKSCFLKLKTARLSTVVNCKVVPCRREMSVRRLTLASITKIRNLLPISYITWCTYFRVFACFPRTMSMLRQAPCSLLTYAVAARDDQWIIYSANEGRSKLESNLELGWDKKY